MKSFLDFIPLAIFYYLLKTTDPKTANQPLLKYFGLSGATEGNDVLVATFGLIISMIVVYGIIFVYQKFKFEKMQLFVLTITVVMGGLTLALHDPTYIKLKAIIINLIVAAAFLTAHYFIKDGAYLVERIFKSLLIMPRKQWKYLNYAWVVMFVLLAMLHSLFAFLIEDGKYWGEFTVFGDLMVMFTFLILQLFLLRKYIKSTVEQQGESSKKSL